MKLTKIKVEKFKRVKAAELQLADLNILVGGNGSGKSSIIQAVHLACCLIRQAGRVEAQKSTTVGVDELDYLPTEHYWALGHNEPWGNGAQSASSDTELEFSDGTDTYTASCILRAARNAGISIRGAIPSQLQSKLRTSSSFFSAYIPGISGIPNTEEQRSEKVILKACSYGDSNIYLRNALLLLLRRDKNNIVQIQKWIAEISTNIVIEVAHDEKKGRFQT